ncbi:hypothetical protein HF860_10410 [Enterococcus gallinarum]|uniref:hypothetical protein n=1 Tax=Enterococcus gallinarum TaxID=1353 RepID=UPI0014744A60|nr:hypothetical protein [Enterococcus gallinarum]NME47568.1 hypothetical protein [Enterococcus gallinarum]
MLKQQVLKPENIKSIELNSNGLDKCYKKPIVINGLKAGDGITTIKLNLRSVEYPEITIVGVPNRIPSDIKESWGLSDSEWDEFSVETATITKEIEGVPENVLPLDYLVNNQAEE